MHNAYLVMVWAAVTERLRRVHEAEEEADNDDCDGDGDGDEEEEEEEEKGLIILSSVCVFGKQESRTFDVRMMRRRRRSFIVHLFLMIQMCISRSEHSELES